MDKSAIKKYAVWAHQELIQCARNIAAKFGIFDHSSDDADLQPEFIMAHREQHDVLSRKIEQIGYEQTMEAAAYAWFRRFCALRLMEVNDYFPSHGRIFIHCNHELKTQINADSCDEERFRLNVIHLCNSLQAVLPGFFKKIEAFEEVLFPENQLGRDSVITRLITDIPEDYFKLGSPNGQVEIIGWLYQYYYSEKHDEIVDPLYRKFMHQEDIPIATQLFTTDWVVRYIVDNSLGRYWIEHHPESQLASELEFYIPQKENIDVKNEVLPEDVTVFDPCVGSGHFLVYAVEVFLKIYRECGYSDIDAIKRIIQNNIYGLDIDSCVVELAYFALMMKGCQFDRDFLKKDVQPHVYSMTDIQFLDDVLVQQICRTDRKLEKCIKQLIDVMSNVRIAGSMLQIEKEAFDKINRELSKIEYKNDAKITELKRILDIAEMISSKYSIVVTNPPYLNKYDSKLKKYLNTNYKDYAGDLFSVFIYRCIQYCVKSGYAGLMTPNVWMFIKSYEKLRRYILNGHSITTLVQMAKGAFFSEATVDVCAFVIQCQNNEQDGIYFRLEEFIGGMEFQKEKLLNAIQNPLCSYRYQTHSALFQNLPGMPIGYWASSHILQAFQKGCALEKMASPRQGLATTDNHKYLRHWFEIDLNRIGFGLDKFSAANSDIKWFPYNKGGEYRKWYGNQDYIVNYQHDGKEIKHDVLTKYPYLKTPDFVVKNPDTYFSPCLSWSKISSGKAAFRYFPQGFLYDVSGCSIFFKCDNDRYYLAGFLNSIVCEKILEIISPTLNYETGHIAILPVIHSDAHQERIHALVKENIDISKEDWNLFENSWAFKKHPLIDRSIPNKEDEDRKILIENRYKVWCDACSQRFGRLKSNEEALNRIFIEIYGLQNELKYQVDDCNVTVRRADLQRDIKSLISYAVGCMCGRYSLDKDGVCCSGAGRGEKTLELDLANSNQKNNHIIPITEYACFEDDIVTRFVDFIRTAFGSETLENNLQFIADALGRKGSVMERIRAYFAKDFYTDHVKEYQKCPIYWQFSSGKKNAFKCLIYIHRYQHDDITRILHDYVHKMILYYQNTEIELEAQWVHASISEAPKLKKQLDKLIGQKIELQAYAEKMQDFEAQNISIDLDDGIRANYEKFKDVLSTLK